MIAAFRMIPNIKHSAKSRRKLQLHFHYALAWRQTRTANLAVIPVSHAKPDLVEDGPSFPRPFSVVPDAGQSGLCFILFFLFYRVLRTYPVEIEIDFQEFIIKLVGIIVIHHQFPA